MPRQFIKHLAVILVGVGSLLYIAQNCGEDHRDLRTDRNSDSATSSSDLATEPMSEVELNLGLIGESEEEAQNAGLSLLASPAVQGFKAFLLCPGFPNTEVKTSPVLVSANSSCKVALQEIQFGDDRGTYAKLGLVQTNNLEAGSKDVFQNAKGDQIMVVVASQLTISDKTASASFRFFQVRREKAIVDGQIKQIDVEGQLAPEFSLVSSEIGLTPAGVVLKTTFSCNGAFRVEGEEFFCGSFAASELNFIYEPIIRTLDFDNLEKSSPGSIDGKNGLLASLAKVAKPLKSYSPLATANGFVVSLPVKDIDSGKAFGLPEQLAIGVGTKEGGVAATVITLRIQ
jgi:hypothetical protein